MLRAVDERFVSSGNGRGEILAVHYRRLGAHSKNAAFDKAFEEEVYDWAKRDEVVSKENSGTGEPQRDFTVADIEECIPNQSPEPQGSRDRCDGARIHEV